MSEEIALEVTPEVEPVVEPEVETVAEPVTEVCPNCNNSGLRCSACGNEG